MQICQIGLNYVNIGIFYDTVGLNESNIFIVYDDIDLNYSNIGISKDNIGQILLILAYFITTLVQICIIYYYVCIFHENIGLKYKYW